MKAKYIFGLVLASTLMTTSCSDFLEEDPKGQFTATTFYSSQDEINMGLVALYRKYHDINQNTDTWHTRWQGEDVTAVNAANKVRFYHFDTFQQTTATQNVATIWNTPYYAIKAANGIINLTDNVKANADSDYQAGVALGMAHFIRAYAYYDIVKKFGPCILNLDNVDDQNTAELSSTKDVYTQILADLQEAESYLPESYASDSSQDGIRYMNGCDVFPTKYAVYGVRGCVYMSMAGYPLNDTSKYSLAAADFKKVIDSGKFELNANFSDIWNIGKEYNKEVVWGTTCGNQGWGTTSDFSSAVLPGHCGSGWYDIVPENCWFEDFPEGPRKDAIYATHVMLTGDNNKVIDWYDDANPRITGGGAPYFKTYACNVSGGKIVEAAYDDTAAPWTGMVTPFRQPNLRLGDIYCLYCEALARTGSPDGLKYLNLVRKRAGLADLSGLTADKLADAAILEHKYETTGDMTNTLSARDDLFRMGEAAMKAQFQKRLDNPKTKKTYGGKYFDNADEVTGVTWNKDQMYAPYSEADAALNPNLTRAKANQKDGI